MKNNRVFILILGVIFAVLIAVAVWQTTPRPVVAAVPTVDVSDPRNVNLVFTTWNPTSVQAMRLDDPQQEADLILERNNDNTWRLVLTSGDGTLDQEIAENLVKTVAFIPYTEVIGSLTADDYAAFGLSSERVWLQIQVILKDKETHNIAVGNLAPGTDGGYYALIDDLAEVYVLERGAIEFLAAYLQQIQSLPVP